MREVGRGYEHDVSLQLLGAAPDELSQITMRIVGADDGERHERAGADEVHGHKHAVVQQARRFGLDDHSLVLVRCRQQGVGELDVVGELAAHVGAAEGTEVALQRRRGLDRVRVHIPRRVGRDDDHRAVVAHSVGQTFHGGHRRCDGLARCAPDLRDQDGRVGTDTSLHGRYLPTPCEPGRRRRSTLGLSASSTLPR